MRMMAVGFALMLLLGSASAQEFNAERKIAGGFATGDFPVVSVFADTHQRAAKVKVVADARVDQRAEVDWSIYCYTEDFKTSGRRSGTFEAQTPIMRYLPIPIAEPDECEINTSVSPEIESPGGRYTLGLFFTPQA